MKELPYGLSARLPLSLDDAIAATKEALKAEGFGILTEIDVRKTLKETIAADFQPYVILGACNPSLAFVALQDDIETGLLIPCNVTVREEPDGGSVVSILDPNVMADVSPSTELREVARLAKEKLARVLEQLSGQAVT